MENSSRCRKTDEQIMRGILEHLKTSEIASVNEIANTIGSNWKVIKNRIKLLMAIGAIKEVRKTKREALYRLS
jgi:ribosomal protein S25